jgi:hypothetical protein
MDGDVKRTGAAPAIVAFRPPTRPLFMERAKTDGPSYDSEWSLSKLPILFGAGLLSS